MNAGADLIDDSPEDKEPDKTIKGKPRSSGSDDVCEHKYIGTDTAGVVECLYCGKVRDLKNEGYDDRK